MSLTSDDLEDIKQLMQTVVGAAFEEQKKYLDERLSDQDKKLDTILDAVGGRFDENEARIDDHEMRIVRLEQRAV